MVYDMDVVHIDGKKNNSNNKLQVKPQRRDPSSRTDRHAIDVYRKEQQITVYKLH